MKKLPILLACVVMISACQKQSTPEPPVKPANPNNRVNANISIKGEPSYSLAANGGSTVFAQRTDPNGEFVITIVGDSPKGAIHLTLVNITTPGAYTFTSGVTSSYAFCTFEIGNPLTGPYELYSTTSTAPPTGTIVITEVTNTFIKGSFTATCSNSPSVVQIDAGTFQGTF